MWVPADASATTSAADSDAVELSYETVDWKPAEEGRLSEALYEDYALQSIRVPGARKHPTRLVQSAAMASVAPPRPTYRPRLPARVVSDGLLPDAQLENVIYAGEAHSSHLAGAWAVDAIFDVVAAAPDDAKSAVRFRRGWFLGDGTGCGRGRQVVGIILDNWLKGRRRALWISKSEALIEDARRDWSAVGQERLLIQPLARFRQGMPIRLDEGILFVTYAHRPYDDEADPRPLPEPARLQGALADVFDALVATLSDTRLEPDPHTLLWSLVNVFHRRIDWIERDLDANERAQCSGQREQDGSEVRLVELERLVAQGLTLIERRNSFEFIRDAAAELYGIHTGQAWRPRVGSMVNRATMTAAMIDSREFINARRRADAQVLLPKGTRIAFAGGVEYSDHHRIWAVLDKVIAKHSEMVLLHGGTPRGAPARSWTTRL